MWDVKYPDKLVLNITNLGFTLTMWDVKDLDKYKVEVSLDKFYLNYVGCKEKKTLNLNYSQNRFTLTMWDVK